MRHSCPLSLGSLVCLALAACGSPPDGSASEGAAESADLIAATASSYVAIGSYWKTSAQQASWKAAVANLKLQFDDICGDTFCGSDYANFEPLELQCAVTTARGSVQSCTWVFAASEAIVDAAKGTVNTSAPHYLCSFAPKGYATALVTAFAAAGSLQAPLPGLTESLYDVVATCLQNPIGATSLGAPKTGTYEDASDADSVDQGAWYSMTGALSASFDDLCAGSFCAKSAYSNIAPFGFDCSIGTKSGKIQECRWVFDGSNSSVSGSTGAIAVNEKAWVCPVPAIGTAQDLMNVLGAAGTVEPLRRKLPGKTTSAYDALAKCLP